MKRLHKKFINIANSLVIEKTTKNSKIELILLGGSVARGDETIHSDIDISFFTKRKYLPSHPRRFYKYKGKFIEETFIPLEDFKKEDVTNETKILFDKNNLLKHRLELLNAQKTKRFNREWSKAKKYLKIAETAYERDDYEKAILHLIGTKSLTFILIQSLLQKFDLPFPSFRLFKSLKKASKTMRDSKVYENAIKLYSVKNLDKKKVLSDFNKVYRIVGKCYKNLHSKEDNLGFYDKLKIEYNTEGLRLTFDDYPPEFALRFITGCIIDWSLNSEELWNLEQNIRYRKKVIKLAKEILGIKEFTKEFTKTKLELTKDLEKRINKILIKKSK